MTDDAPHRPPQSAPAMRPRPLVAVADLQGALGLLTRLPGGGAGRGGASAWAWPLAGALVAALAVLPGIGLMAMGVGAGIAAAAVLGVQAMLTGALHEDGLADSADGLFGGHDRSRRLEIMKDSRIGSFGVLALMLTVLARWSALAALLMAGGAFWAVIAAAALSRAGMACLMSALAPARAGGLSAAVGRPHSVTACLAVMLAALLALPGLDWGVVLAVALVAVATMAVGRIARARIGGQTGDILGAAQQISEVAVLALAASLI